MLFQLWIDLNVAQFFDIEEHLVGLEEKFFPHSILHPPAPLHQPGSVLKDVATNSDRLQKEERGTVRRWAGTSSPRQWVPKVYLQVRAGEKKMKKSAWRSARKEGNVLWSGVSIWGGTDNILKAIYKSVPECRNSCSEQQRWWPLIVSDFQIQHWRHGGLTVPGITAQSTVWYGINILYRKTTAQNTKHLIELMS